MEQSELDCIRLSSNPIGEICDGLSKGTLQAAEAIQTGLIPLFFIHQYVAYCMSQMVLLWREASYNIFKAPVLERAIQIKLRCANAITDTIALSVKNAEQEISAMAYKCEDWYDTEKAVLKDLAGCLSMDAYEAHSFTAVILPPVDGVEESKVEAQIFKERRKYLLSRLISGKETIGQLWPYSSGQGSDFKETPLLSEKSSLKKLATGRRKRSVW